MTRTERLYETSTYLLLCDANTRQQLVLIECESRDSAERAMSRINFDVNSMTYVQLISNTYAEQLKTKLGVWHEQ